MRRRGPLPWQVMMQQNNFAGGPHGVMESDSVVGGGSACRLLFRYLIMAKACKFKKYKQQIVYMNINSHFPEAKGFVFSFSHCNNYK